MPEGDDIGEALRQALSESLQKEKLERANDAAAAKKKIDDLEKRVKSLEAAAPPPRSAKPPPPLAHDEELRKNLESTLERVKELQQLLARTRRELSDLQAEEVATAKKRTKVLTDACELLATACGETGQAPPPIPIVGGGPIRKNSLTIDISEVAELLESLRPPKA